MSQTFRQYDSRWAKLGYPSGSDTMANSGCGATACASVICNNPKYSDITPAQIRDYMVKNNFAIKGSGTSWAGITACLRAYGFNVINHESMATVWTEMAKGNRWGVVLFRAGTRGGVTWTTCGHFVAFSAYKYEKGKHWLYTRDPSTRKNDGWHAYESTMYGLIPQIWTISLPVANSLTNTTTKVLPSSWYMTAANWKKVQSWLGCNATGYLGGQKAANKKYYKGLVDLLKNVDGSGKSDTIKAMQKWLGVTQTGLITQAFVKVLQKKLGVKDVNGIWGDVTSKALIAYIGSHAKPTYPAPTPAAKSRRDKFIDALESYGKEIEKSFKYSNSNSRTTWAAAKKNHITNCARYISWALQYAGVLGSGKCIYCTTSLKGSGAAAIKSSKLVSFSRPQKTVKAMAKAGKLQKGDVVMFTNGKHTMAVRSVNKSTGVVYFYTAGSSDVKAKNVRNRRRSTYDNRKIAYLIRIK